MWSKAGNRDAKARSNPSHDGLRKPYMRRFYIRKRASESVKVRRSSLFCALYADRVPEKTIRQVIKGRPAGIIIKAAGKQDSGRETRVSKVVSSMSSKEG